MRLPIFFRMVFNTRLFEKIFAWTLLIFFGWFFQSFFTIFLITFLFAYLFLDMGKNLYGFFAPHMEKIQNPALRRYFLWAFSLTSMVTVVYVAFIALVSIVFSVLLPKLINEGGELLKNFPLLAGEAKFILYQIQSHITVNLGLTDIANSVLSSHGITSVAQTVFENVKNTGIFMTKFLIALMLSYIFVIDRAEIMNYLSQIKNSNFSFLYREYAVIFEKIQKGFGFVLRAQAIIALVNALLTGIGLILISVVHNEAFPYMLTLSLIVFIFGFIPVLGTFISSVPILLIGFSYGGLPVMLEIVAMILVIHAVETYFLNPKIVSSYTRFPIFVTFIVLLVSEQLMGFVGLLLGVPLFSILVDVLKDINAYISRVQDTKSGLKEARTMTKHAIATDIRLSRS